MKRQLMPFGVVLAIAVLPAAGVSASPESTLPESAQLLDEPAQGVEAVLALGDDLPVAAARNDMTAEELRSLLLNDAAAGVAPSGRVYYAEPLPAPVPDTGDAPVQVQSGTVDVFALESLPGAQRTIFIDFDGHEIPGISTWTNSNPTSISGPLPAFDRDGFPSTFSSEERALIAAIWAQVAEDFAPFAVNVTTKDPGVEAIRRTNQDDQIYGTRVVVTHSPAASDAICNNRCGGVAYLNTFNWTAGDAYPEWQDYYDPGALVFSNNYPHSGETLVKRLGEVISHEVGHTLDLNHSGVVEPVNELVSIFREYYAGHGAWAPIMGSANNRPISHWSRGDYPGARNDYWRTPEPDDEIAIMLNRGLSLRVDDHGGTVGTATALERTAGSSGLQASGVIERREDLDVFRVDQPCDGTIDVVAAPAPIAPNLDIQVRLLDSTGNQLASADPPSSFVSALLADGLGASLSLSRPAGTYYVEIDGVGAGTPADGYSDYASLGSYSLEITTCEPPPTPQVISFTTDPPDPGLVGGTYAPTATGGDSGQPLVISTHGDCTIDGGVVTFTRAGTCEVHADQAGSAGYLAAARVTQTIEIVRRTPTPPTMTNLPTSGTIDGGFVAVVVTDSDGVRSVTSSTPTVCTADGLQVSFVAAGTCTLAAVAGESVTFQAAVGAPQSLQVAAAPVIPEAGRYNSNFDGSALLRVKPNQAIPLKWAFTDGTTNQALLAGTVTLTSSSTSACSVAAIDGVETATEASSGSSGLQLLPDLSYQVNWKATTTTGCRALTVTAPYAAPLTGTFTRTILVDIRK